MQSGVIYKQQGDAERQAGVQRLSALQRKEAEDAALRAARELLGKE